MKFDNNAIKTTDGMLEEGKNYIYKESLPSALLLFCLDKIEKGLEPTEPNYVILHITILNSMHKKDIGTSTTLGFEDGKRYYYAGMFRIYDADAWIIVALISGIKLTAYYSK